MSKVAIQGNASGTGTFTIAAPNSNTDRTLTLPDEAGTVLTSASDITQNSGPAVYAHSGAGQSISNSSWTKVLFSTEGFDTDGCWASSRFTPNVEGYYQISAQLQFNSFATADSYLTSGLSMDGGSSFIRILSRDVKRSGGYNYGAGGASMIYMNGTTDYVEFFVFQSTGATKTLSTNQDNLYFTAHLARTA